jgi:hypothetical protein
MMANKKHIPILMALLLIQFPRLFAQQGEYVTVRDMEVWTSVELKYKINKKWKIGFEEQLRLKNNATEVDQYFSELTANYSLNKAFTVGVGGRFVRENDNQGKIQGYENHFRWNFDLGYEHKIDRLSLAYRLRYQTKSEWVENASAKNNFRLKIEGKYNFNHWKFDPVLSAEIFNSISNDMTFNKIRWTAGTSYSAKNIGEFGLFYRMERELNESYPKTTNIIGFNYQYTIKAKNKKNEKSK